MEKMVKCGETQFTIGKNIKKIILKWWISRIEYLVKLTDYLRIDHFIGFYHYWEIPKGGSPIDGKWAPTFGKENV